MFKILTSSFYLLFFLTPLIWASWTSELFEFNKMMFVYFITILVTCACLLKTINDKRLTISRTPLDIPILLFLGANILSTIFSIDTHTSIWGYYSRLNGGLLSIIAYIILYYALVSNFDSVQILKFIKAALFSGVLISIWAIFEHFGVSLSCIILTGEASTSCWVQDVQARVFATLGQPNWLSAYLLMLIFPAFYFLLTASSKLTAIRYTLYAILLYLAFTFTYSRGSTLGFLAGLIVFIVPTIISHTRGMILVLASYLIINILFGSALTDFKLVSKFAPSPRPAINLTTTAPTGTQLETEGAESGQIRLIVWQGALEIFKANPVLGSGLETFAYAYYKFRPVQHNLTVEWDFLYNKAHNEFLNYLATTGIVGFSSYIIMIITFIIVILKKFRTRNLLIVGFLAAYIGNLVQSFFSFSTVNTNLFFFLFPAIAFIVTDSTKPARFITRNSILITLLSNHPKFFQGVVLVFTGFLLFSLVKNYRADMFFAEGSRAIDSNPGRAYNNFSAASSLNPGEPNYQSELGFAAASASVSLDSIDATLSGKLKKQAVNTTEKVLLDHPGNVSYFRTAIRVYYLLSTIDPKFTQKTLEIFDRAIHLAPTDAKLYYNKGVVLDGAGEKTEAKTAIEEALKLKSNYKEAKEALEKLQNK